MVCLGTSLRKGDSQLRNNSFITTLHDSPSSPRNSTLTRGVYVGNCLQTCFLPATNPPERLGYFSNLFPHYISPPLSLRIYSPMKMERTECSETLAFKLQTPGNNPKANIRHSKHGESLKIKNRFDLVCKVYI
jgi:hypothetical protein